MSNKPLSKKSKFIFVVMMLVLVLASFLGAVASKINPEDFVFPKEMTTPFSTCEFENGTSGHCIIASQCPKVHEEYLKGVNPTLCYFAKCEPIVCCVTEHTKVELVTLPTTVPEQRNATVAESEVQTTTTTLPPLFDPWKNEFVTYNPTAEPEDVTTLEPEEQNFTPSISSPQPEFVAIPKPDEQNVTRIVLTKPSEDLVKRRKSVANCEDVYSQAVPFEFEPGTVHITIVGGEVTEEGEFPHMAALGWTNAENKINWRCGGTLISHDYVMTAAHCVEGRTPPDVIRVGEKKLTISSTSEDFGIEKIIPHPDYQSTQLYHDIALIQLNKTVKITTKIRPACLWQGNTINFTDVTATGYGHTSFGGRASDELLKVDLKVVSNDECLEGFKSERNLSNGIVESQLCAGDSTGEKDTCQGDSGGPIQVSTKNDDQIVYHIIGVTSFGKACATTLPGVYTRVSHYLDWIEDIVWN